MNIQDPDSILLETFERCRGLVPDAVANNLALVAGDPKPLRKKQTDILRIRVMPKKRTPAEFWSSAWCFYEVGLGVYGGKLTVGGVSFVQFPFQKACGNSRYLQPVISILEKLEKEAPGFELTRAAVGQAATQLQRLYRNKDFPFFPAEQAGKDLAWLISRTLPAFDALKSQKPEKADAGLI